MAEDEFGTIKVNLYRVTVERGGVKIVRYSAAKNPTPVIRIFSEEITHYGGKIISVENIRAVGYIAGEY
jgi:hypothetical protein